MGITKFNSAEEIWEQYREVYKNRKGTLMLDGIINPEKYEGILFFLKEGNQENSNNREFDLTEFLCNCERPWKMWNRAAEWIYGIDETTTESVPPYSIFKSLDDETMKQQVNKIALININKADGTGSPTKDDIDARLIWAIENNADLLRAEIALAKPRVIVCGATYWYLQKLYNNLPKKCDGYKGYCIADLEDNKNVLIIDTCHPASRSSALLSYYGITNIYQQALKEGWAK